MINNEEREFLTIFHMDMNHVSLREDYLRKWLKRVADMGYNAILWELEDKVRWETCAQAVWPEAMSKDRFRSILDYSHQLGLSAIPLLQTVGHGEYIMKHEPYAHMREQRDRYDCYCTSNGDVRKFLKEMIGEYLDLFDDIKHFHLGGDEAYVFASCPVCKAAAEKTSRNQIYAEHIMEIAKPICDRGVRPGIWCDMILHYPEDVECVPKELTMWDWNYWDSVNEPDVVHLRQASAFVGKDQLSEDTLKTMPEVVDDQGRLRIFYTVDVLRRLDYDVFLCSSTRSWGDPFFCGIHGIHSGNVIGAARKTVESRLLGHCVTSWGVRLFNYETQQAWLAMATQCKRTNNYDYEAIVAKCGEDILGVDPKEFFEAIEKIAAGIPFVTSGENHGAVIQWTGMKDSLPAPSGYIQSILDEWKNEDDGKTYEQKKGMLTEAISKIIKGQAALERIASQLADAEHIDLLSQWRLAAAFQISMAKIVQKVFDRFETGCREEDTETVSELNQIHSNCNEWMLNWMTCESAKLNSELIFKPLIEYFGQQRD